MSVRDLLAHPAAFRAFTVLIGSPRAKEILVREYIRPTAGDRLLDIGCGIGEIVPFLPAVEYVGFDENPDYVRAARERHPGRTFMCQQIETAAFEADAFDIAVAAGVLHHLDDEGAGELLRLADRSLKPGGRLVMIDGCYVDGQSTASRWLLSRDRGDHVRSKDEYLRLMQRVFGDVRVEVRHDLLRVPYTHLIAECVRTRAIDPPSRSA